MSHKYTDTATDNTWSIYINNNKTKSEKNKSLMTEVEPTEVYNGKDFLFQD